MSLDQQEFLLEDIASELGAIYQGQSGISISGLATLESAGSSDLAFLANKKYATQLASTRAAAVILSTADADRHDGNKIISANPYLDFARLTHRFAGQGHVASGRQIHPTATIADNVELPVNITIGANAVIGAGAVLGEGCVIGANSTLGNNTRLGQGSLLYANVTVYDGCAIGCDCILHSACVIGADGFGFAPLPDGGWQKIYQLGRVVIGDNVEIGAGSTVDRGALDDTVIGSGVKIDNQVQIAHNVQIGENTAIASATAIAGSTVIGKNCTIAGCVGVVGHITICDGVHITGMSMVSKSIDRPGSYSSGVPMSETAKWRKNAARFNQLDDLSRQLRRLKQD